VLELDQRPDGAAIQQALLELTGQRTVPNVFVRGKHLGGNDATQQAHKTGSLQRLLS
jgi:glutaredoxin 3